LRAETANIAQAVSWAYKARAAAGNSDEMARLAIAEGALRAVLAMGLRARFVFKNVGHALRFAPQLPGAPAGFGPAMQRALASGAAQDPIGKISPLGPPIFRACLRVRPLRIPIYRIGRSTMHQHRRPDNSVVFQAAREHPGRSLPYAFVNPLLGQDAHDELDRCMERGARGLKLHLWFHRYRLPDALPVLE